MAADPLAALREAVNQQPKSKPLLQTKEEENEESFETPTKHSLPQSQQDARYASKFKISTQ